MQITARFDPEASRLADVFTFYQEKFELTREDIELLKEAWMLRFVEPDTLPESIPCQVLILASGPKRAKISFFNPVLKLPEEVYEERFLNRDIIAWSEQNGWFYLEFEVPMDDKRAKIDFDFEFNA